MSIRCAIYTRKSTEYGLEQDFNSLDAQREASEAYIKSQAHEGWRLLPAHYDDGGVSGGTLERPALQSLLGDIRARKVDVVVVYKIDRLTRSLADFAKLVELFEANAVSFVSVTQQFNTTTSMGRLTLNVLLSFAQFEREVTAERIRDKIAASKQKGIWMGGPLPLGYAVQDRKLIIVEEEAEQVRAIFARYLELKSLFALQKELRARGIVSKKRKLTDGRVTGGKPYYVGGLAHLLQNRMYIGELPHKGKSYPGQHPPIIDKALFDAVQAQFEANAHELKRTRMESGALLMGKLYDDAGNLMSPMNSQKNKGAARYRYYVSSPLRRGGQRAPGTVSRVPAPDIEAAVLEGLRQVWQARNPEIVAPVPDDRTLVATLLERAVLTRGSIEITLIHPEGAATSSQRSDFALPFQVRTVRRRRGQIVPEGSEGHIPVKMRSNKRKRLILAIAKARSWADELVTGRIADTTAIAKREGVTERHVRMTLPLAFLAPEIVHAIIQGTLLANMGKSRFVDRIPLSWNEQARQFQVR